MFNDFCIYQSNFSDQKCVVYGESAHYYSIVLIDNIVIYRFRFSIFFFIVDNSDKWKLFSMWNRYVYDVYRMNQLIFRFDFLLKTIQR